MPNYVKLEDLETFDTDLRGGDEGRRAQRGEEQRGARPSMDSVAACLSKAIYVPASAAAAAAANAACRVAESPPRGDVREPRDAPPASAGGSI